MIFNFLVSKGTWISRFHFQKELGFYFLVFIFKWKLGFFIFKWKLGFGFNLIFKGN